MNRVLMGLLAISGCSLGSVAPTPGFEERPRVRLAASRLVDPLTDPRPVPDGPNVVLIIVSSWRADQLAPWGGPPQTGPIVSGLAKQGVFAKTTIASAPSGKAAAASLLTGLTPDAAGLVAAPGGPDLLALDAQKATLAVRLQLAGWSTIGVTGSPYLNVVWGMDQGFEVYLEAPVAPASAEAAAKVPSAEVVDRMLVEAKQRTDPGRPLYLQLALVDAHRPIEVSAEAIAAQQADGVSRGLARYRAGLAQQDAAIGALVDGLAAQGMDATNTVFVLVGDHGESLGDGMSAVAGHGYTLGPDVAVVPWIMFGKGIKPGIIEGFTSHTDVLPTVLALAGQPLPGGLARDGSLAELARQGGGTSGQEQAFITTSVAASARSAVYTDTLMCQVDHDPKATARTAERLPFAAGCCAWRTDPDCAKPEWDPALLEITRTWHADQLRASSQLTPVTAALNPVELQQLRVFGDVE